MALEVLVNCSAAETRIARVEDGVLEGYAAEPVFGGGARVGDIYLGRVTKVVPAMQAAFVDIGHDRDGFLGLRDAGPLHEGAAVTVQVSREAEGEKGARLTARIPLSAEMEARRGMVRPPALLQAGPDAIARLLQAVPDGTPVLIDDARVAERVRRAFPGLAVKSVRDEVFARHDMEDQVAALSVPRVPLACGGWITLEHTEALTAIDVNSGSFAASGGRGETARRVNLEAAREIGRQILLRGIGGLIVVDFIQLDGGADGQAVVAALTQALSRGEGAVEVSALTAFGIVAIARQRRQPRLHSGQACRCCAGSGRRPAVDAVAARMLRAVERSARAAPGREIVVRAAPSVTDWLAAHAAEVRAGLDRRGVGQVRYLAEAREDFDVGTV